MAKLIKKYKEDVIPPQHCFICKEHDVRGNWCNTKAEAVEEGVQHTIDEEAPHKIRYLTVQTITSTDNH